MNPDYVFILLLFLIILLFFLAIKYFKYLLFYLGVLSGILISVFGKIFIEDKNYNLSFIKILFNNLFDFFSKSKIIQFLAENLGILFLLFIILLFHRFFYYLVLIILYFLKWFSSSLISWLKDKKTIISKKEIKEEN